MTDVVYPYRLNNYGFEIRYSMRSLVNLDHGSVIVAGDKPNFVSESVKFVHVAQREQRFMDSTMNIFNAAIHAVTTDYFYVMNDDIFIMEPRKFRHEHRDRPEMTGAAAEYRKYTDSTYDILKAYGVDEPLFFGIHKPTMYNRENLIDMVKEFSGELYLLRTMYHNLFPSPSVKGDDVKIYNWSKRSHANASAGGILSISDSVANDFNFRAWIDEKFPNPSKYEVSQ